MGKREPEVTAGGPADLNKETTKERFDSFYKWSNIAIEKEFNTAVWEHINLSEVSAISELLNKPGCEKHIVLDAGCGSGRMLFELGKRYAKVIGSDFSIGLMKKAKDIGVPADGFVQADIENLPFKDETFDTVLCVRVIQHLKPKQQLMAVKEMARVLKKGGRLILMTYNALTILCAYKAINMGPLYKVWPRWPLRDWKWMVDDYSFPWEMKRMFEASSLDVTNIRGAVIGEPEMFKFLKASNFIEKWFGPVFRAWFSLCRKIDSGLCNIWPFKFFMGRVLIEGKKR